jgi:dienelactone hydrolase
MRFEINDSQPLIDEAVGFWVTDVAPGAAVVVSARWELGGASCESSGHFVADADGIVSPRTQPSLDGTYRGVEPLGMWWSARLDDVLGSPTLDPIVVKLTASTELETIEETIVRRRIAPDVVVEAVNDDGLVGMYFRPPGDGMFPAAVVFGGSGGGFSGADTTAGLLASRGIASLALAYFGLPGLPPGLAEVPLEYFSTAIRWLAMRSEVDGNPAVVGPSRGGELALLLGATFSEVGAVVAQVPSSVVWGSFGPGSGPEVPAWTLEGRPIAWMASDDQEAWAEVERTSPIVSTPGFLAELRNAEAVSVAQIRVERALCPILMISGEEDAMWPSTLMAEQVEYRASTHGYGSRLVHLRYSDAGHRCASTPGLSSPLTMSHPVDHEVVAFGGSLRGNAAAQSDSWSKTIEFLHDVLPNRGRRPSSVAMS